MVHAVQQTWTLWELINPQNWHACYYLPFWTMLCGKSLWYPQENIPWLRQFVLWQGCHVTTATRHHTNTYHPSSISFLNILLSMLARCLIPTWGVSLDFGSDLQWPKKNATRCILQHLVHKDAIIKPYLMLQNISVCIMLYKSCLLEQL